MSVVEYIPIERDIFRRSIRKNNIGSKGNIEISGNFIFTKMAFSSRIDIKRQNSLFLTNLVDQSISSLSLINPDLNEFYFL